MIRRALIVAALAALVFVACSYFVETVDTLDHPAAPQPGLTP